jgi:hypothetical protein
MAYSVTAVGFEAELETNLSGHGPKTVKWTMVVRTVYQKNNIITIAEVEADSSTSVTFKLRPPDVSFVAYLNQPTSRHERQDALMTIPQWYCKDYGNLKLEMRRKCEGVL